jgi:intraflagellar transport protein 172
MRVTVAMLRYSEFIRLDKLFYEAGMSCQKANNSGFASVLLNRYLDISEIIDDPETDNVPDEGEFKVSDIPSIYDVNMPIKNDIIS